MILLAEHDEPSLAAKKKQRPVALEKATPTPKNRVWNFFGSPLGQIRSESDLSAETATGSVQFSYENASGRAYYYTRDHLGSVREMTDGSGTIQARYDYDPYGRTTLVSGTNICDFQYAGYYAHQPSGLNLTMFRAYDPNTARWLSRDPIAENGGMNLYGYVANDPSNYTDPYGLGPAPTLPNGQPAPPPIPLPDGKNGSPNSWKPIPGSPDRPIKWVPRYPVPSPKGGQPSCSWGGNEPGRSDHWDYDDGAGKGSHIGPDGKPIDPNAPVPPSPIPIPLRVLGPVGAAIWLLGEELQLAGYGGDGST